MARLTADQRFDTMWRLDPASGCHVWTRGIQQHSLLPELGGYPKFWANGKSAYAHRYALARKLGRNIKRGYEADHVCHNRRCVFPDHLREVRKRTNMREMNARMWARRMAVA